ncbi:hypothetical protein KUCAC02_033969, partial [Chaenocephalus aceratus]
DALHLPVDEARGTIPAAAWSLFGLLDLKLRSSDTPVQSAGRFYFCPFHPVGGLTDICSSYQVVLTFHRMVLYLLVVLPHLPLSRGVPSLFKVGGLTDTCSSYQ